jgi:HEAT repeat protein
LLARLELSPEAQHAVMLLLRSNPRSETESGVPPVTDAPALAREAVAESEDDDARIRAQLASSSPSLAAARALGTALRLAERDRNVGAIDAVGDALGRALAAGAFKEVAAATAMLAEAATDPALEMSVRRARQPLADPETLAKACGHVRDAASAEAAAPVFAAAGAAGAEALLSAWERTQGTPKQALEIVARFDADQVLVIAGRRVRSGQDASTTDLIALLGRIGDRRAAPVLGQALENRSAEVRVAAVETLARMDSDDAWRVVAGALHHSDEGTARRALYEIRMAEARRAIPDLIAALTSPLPSRSWEFKREVVDCLKELQATEAVPALKREAGHIFAFTAKRRMLRQAARDALVAIREDPPRG